MSKTANELAKTLSKSQRNALRVLLTTQAGTGVLKQVLGMG
jgi:MarR-like DNA-binding transcriptional regulator SgrR of sgrS sRNA